jgi:glycosyltransferase involved in cell wall biosynthesis
MNRPIAFNLVRGIFGALQTTPRGIDRIDFGYRGYLLEHWPRDCVGVMPTPIGMRYYPRDIMQRGHERLAAFWKEEAESLKDGAFIRLRAALNDPEFGGLANSKRRGTLNVDGYWRLIRLILGNGIRFGKSVADLPKDTIYLDVGHYGLGTPMLLNWLDLRPDISPVFMLHDAIPLEFPELVADDTVRGHEKVLAMTARHARSVIVPTNAAGKAVKAELARRGSRDISIHPVPLPIDQAFLGRAEPYPEFMAKPYFMICGAIEVRKNHDVLIEVWSDLVARLGKRAPHLIIAGAPGFGSADIIRRIEARDALKGHLLIASGLSTPSLARLMAGARAVLMPSLAEGFGLPPIEALSLGTPAVLSDIEAHRDAAGDFGIYLDPSDVAGWTARIENMTEDTDDYMAWKNRIAHFRPYDWQRYMAEISDILRHVG